MGLFMLGFGLVFIVGSFALGLAIAALLLRASVAVVRSLFKLDGRPQAPTNWSNQQVYGQQQPYGGQPYRHPQGGYQLPQANPYSAPTATPMYAGYGATQGQLLPMPTFGKAMLVMFIAFLINFAIGFASNSITVALQQPIIDLLVRLVSFVGNLAILVLLLKHFLPTSYAWAGAVTLAYFLICVAIGLLIGVLILLPMMVMNL